MNNTIDYIKKYFQVKSVLKEYYRRYASDGVESASTWLSFNLPEEHIEDFKRLQPEAAKKFGFKHPARAQ